MKKFIKILISVIMLLVFWLISWWLFKIRNKTTIIGRENLPKKTGILLLSNHQSLIDSMLIAYALFNPHDIFWRYQHIPWNAAAWENFFQKRILRIFCYFLKTIPAYRQRGMEMANKNIQEYNRILDHGNLLLFFEGTRSRDGKIGPCAYGPARVISERQPLTIPIRIENMDKVMPISVGFKWHKIRGGQKIVITIGKPLIIESSDINFIRHSIRESIINL